LPLANLRCLNSQPQTELAVPQKDKLYSRLEIELKGIEPEVMKSYAWYAQKSAEHLGIQVGRCYAARKADKDRWTVLKSVHVHAKHLVSYEVRTYYRFLNFHNLTQSTLETFLEYIQRNLPEGTAMKATKIEIQKLPEHIEQAIQEENN
jgi:small subunit ribosomal protein S10